MDVHEAMRAAAAAGYRFVEPFVHTPLVRKINSHLSIAANSPYHHIDTSTADAAWLDGQRRDLGLRFSAVDAHCSLLLPQIAVPYLRGAVEFAAATECGIVISDEGPVDLSWMDLGKALDVMCFALEPVLRTARSHAVLFAVELHNELTARPEHLMKLLDRFAPDELGVNFDTGNAFLAGNDPAEYLQLVASRVVHVHLKDIPQTLVHQRGRVTGTRVGVAAGEGVIDVAAILRVLADNGYEGVVSVECDTCEQAARSLPYLQSLIHGGSQGTV